MRVTPNSTSEGVSKTGAQARASFGRHAHRGFEFVRTRSRGIGEGATHAEASTIDVSRVASGRLQTALASGSRARSPFDLSVVDLRRIQGNLRGCPKVSASRRALRLGRVLADLRRLRSRHVARPFLRTRHRASLHRPAQEPTFFRHRHHRHGCVDARGSSGDVQRALEFPVRAHVLHSLRPRGP